MGLIIRWENSGEIIGAMIQAFCMDSIMTSPPGLQELNRQRKDEEIIEEIVYSGIPVLGHIGVTKQNISRDGTIRLPEKAANRTFRSIHEILF